ncbi:MAG: cytochrome c biogenesis protein CcdA [Proteobacteria bacterium]|nr:cytochrome c biogenesis protein CcdA [Pseudomonadota bacterium]
METGKIRRITIVHSLMFILGFSLVFVSLGATASYFGNLMASYQSHIMKIGGIIIIVLGVHFTGIISIPFLQMEKRFELGGKPVGYVGSVLIGIVFAAGWTPCIGPILSTILLYAGTTKHLKQGIALLVMYSAGLGLPFLLASLAINTFLSYVNWLRKYLRIVTVASGCFLILVGILFVTDRFALLNMYLNMIFPYSGEEILKVDTQSLGMLIAFVAGLLSFVSPCVLPLIPSYLSYMTGLSFSDLTQK